VGSNPTGPTHRVRASGFELLFEYTSKVIYPLLTDRLIIEPLALADLETFLEYRQDPEIARYQSWDSSYSKAQALELIESQAGVLLPEKGNWLQLGLHERTTSELIGDLAIHAVAEQKDCFELGFTIARNQQKKGFAKEATSKLLEHLTSESGAKKFIATPDARNEASIRLLLALGFSQDPTKTWTEEFKGETVTVFFFERG
jgi:RimJ/RimL family protein N-acetyltransferase